ncbi:MAG: UDP-N-acetylmuramate dehydrogenase [Gammaproteobacteria bacterium]
MTMAVALPQINHRGRLVTNEPLARHSSWRTGGTAEYFFEPEDTDDLINVIGQFESEKITWLGLGSNVLIRDGGISGLVISTAKGLNFFNWLGDEFLEVGCGVACAKVAKESVRRNCFGGEFLAGIPGTIGGALAMNAGAFGGETWDLVASAKVVNRAGEVSNVAPGEYVTGYRHVGLPADHWFLSAQLHFHYSAESAQESDNSGQQRIRDLLAERSATQPTGVASCGSVFKNPPDDYAGRLIEAAGLKGFRMGACGVSEKHANFIVNEQGASATEIEALVKHIQSSVLEQFGVFLEPEVRIIGEPLNEDGP